MTKEELKQFILDNFPIKNTKLTTDPVRWCNRKYPELIDVINSMGPYETLSDNIYYIILGRENRCECCNKLISLTWLTRDNKYCSRKCMVESENWTKSREQTMLERYGVKHSTQNDAIKEKARQTSLDRYGVDNPAKSPEIIAKIDATFMERYGVRRAVQVPEFKAKQHATNVERYGNINPLGNANIKQKATATMHCRYGVESPLQSPVIREKYYQTSIARYGTTSPMQCDEIKNKVLSTKYGIDYSSNPKLDYLSQIGVESDANHILIGPTKYGMVSKECIVAQLNVDVTVEMLKNEFGDYHYAMKRLGIQANGNISTPHQIILDFLAQHNIRHETNNRQVIKPKELDIFIPDHSLAIEVNGLYWHSTTATDTRHLDKFMQCNNAGIRLLQFTDRDILDKTELIKSMILSKLGMLPTKLMARKCKIIDVSRQDAIDFLSRCHYQGRTTNAAKYIGLLHGESLVAVLAYTVNDNIARIERFACELFTNVVGGYSRLEKELTRRHSVSTLITFSLGLISDGSLYKNNGYVTDGYSTTPEWYVTDYKHLYNRQQFMKTKLKNKFGDNFNPELTERQNILNNGYRLYFGAGITKWEKEIK